MSGLSTDAVLDLLREVADEVIAPRFRSLSEGEVMEKRPGDLVTVADREAEVRITDRLLEAYPGAVVLGEEAFAEDRDLMDRYLAADHAFTVDPVDGTKNFVHGSPTTRSWSPRSSVGRRPGPGSSSRRTAWPGSPSAGAAPGATGSG